MNFKQTFFFLDVQKQKNQIWLYAFQILYVTICWFILDNIFLINYVSKRFFLPTYSINFFSDFCADNFFLSFFSRPLPIYLIVHPWRQVDKNMRLPWPRPWTTSCCNRMMLSLRNHTQGQPRVALLNPSTVHQGERTKFDRFVDMNVRGAKRRVHSALRIYRNWDLSST